MDKGNVRRLLVHFLIELAIYSGLLVVYFLLVLRLLGSPLTRLFHGDLPLYALIGLVLIVVQAVVLEWITSFLVEQLRLERLK